MVSLLECFRRWLSPDGAAIPEWTVSRRDGATVYDGAFAVFAPGGRLLFQLPGRVVERPGSPVDLYVQNPPTELLHHSHGPCWQLLTPGSSWFKLHWTRPPQDFDTSRAYVEQMLSESCLGQCR